MEKTKSPSIISQIVDLLYTEGSMTVSDMCKTIKFPYKSVYTKALELQKLGLAEKDDDGVWSLADGVTPQTLVTGEKEMTTGEDTGAAEEEPGEEAPPSGKKPAPIVRSTGAPLDQKGMFIQELKNIGVTPKEAIPTVANIFFSGDIDKLKWLEQVLKRDAAGFVTHHQRRLIISWWSHTRGLPYQESDFFPDTDEEGKPKKEGAKVAGKETKAGTFVDPGIGWRVDKDKDGDWKAIAGGPMQYEDALAAAERRAAIAAMQAGQSVEVVAEAGEGGEGKPAGKAVKRPESSTDYLMKKIIDDWVEGGRGRGDGDSETVRKLTERIDTMERERNEERFERLEGMVAQVLSRDPWEDYDRIEAMKQRLGVGGPVVTDQSPAVQLIKDSTDKVDKGLTRLLGVIERTALHSEEFTPETTRSPKQREEKAGELLGEVDKRERSRSIRREAFGR